MRSLTKPERETVVTWSDDDRTAYIWTAQRPVITKLENNPAAVKVKGGFIGSSEWAEFTLPASLISFRTRRTELSEASRAKRVASLAKARAAKRKAA